MHDDTAHLLVIDDDTRLRDLLQRYLSEQGFRVTTATDAIVIPFTKQYLSILVSPRALPIASRTCGGGG